MDKDENSNTTDVKAEVFPPAVFFYAVFSQIKVVFFNSLEHKQ